MICVATHTPACAAGALEVAADCRLTILRTGKDGVGHQRRVRVLEVQHHGPLVDTNKVARRHGHVGIS